MGECRDAERSQYSSGGASSLDQSASDSCGRRGTDRLGDLKPETVGHKANAIATPVGVQGELRLVKLGTKRSLLTQFHPLSSTKSLIRLF